MQLVAFGAQDAALSANPEITFFRIVYRRHTNFAIEAIEQVFSGTVGFGKKVSCVISRNGDLITNMFLEITLTKDSGDTYWPAEAFVKDVELEIGGAKIDKLYSDFVRVQNELFLTSSSAKAAYRRMVDFVDDEPVGSVKRFYYPLSFFFNKNVGQALPLIALQYHEVRLYFNFAEANADVLPGIDTTAEPTATLYVDFVYLDTDERRRYAQKQHEFLIEQLQYSGAEAVTLTTSKKSQNFRLNLNHPVKFLAWVVKGSGYAKFTAGDPGATADALAPLYSAKLTLNGHDRFSERRGSYFSFVQPWQTLKANPAAGIYMYSFALKPDEHQPSGSCNFSRIDNATLALTFKAANASATGVSNIFSEDYTATGATDLTEMQLFAVNYNLLRIMSGMGGLAFSN